MCWCSERYARLNFRKVGADLEYRDHNDLVSTFAAQRGDVKMMAYLNDHGANPYDRPQDGQTVVHIAARRGKWVC